jgi:ribonuclease P protein subunit RPR2
MTIPGSTIPKGLQRRIARERIAHLLHLAERELDDHRDRSRRYVSLARRISMRCKVRMPGEWRRRICKRCNLLLVPGKTSTVRIRDSRLNVTCRGCGRVHRYPYGRDVT